MCSTNDSAFCLSDGSLARPPARPPARHWSRRERDRERLVLTCYTAADHHHHHHDAPPPPPRPCLHHGGHSVAIRGHNGELINVRTHYSLLFIIIIIIEKCRLVAAKPLSSHPSSPAFTGVTTSPTRRQTTSRGTWTRPLHWFRRAWRTCHCSRRGSLACRWNYRFSQGNENKTLPVDNFFILFAVCCCCCSCYLIQCISCFRSVFGILIISI